jgi:hypothetical protein
VTFGAVRLATGPAGADLPVKLLTSFRIAWMVLIFGLFFGAKGLLIFSSFVFDGWGGLDNGLFVVKGFLLAEGSFVELLLEGV